MTELSAATLDGVTATLKPRDAWWTVLLVDPYAVRLVRFADRYRWITPDLLSGVAFAFGMTAAVCFYQAQWPWLAAGALCYHLSFTLDCVDGKLARLQGRTSIFGAWLDYIFDRVRELTCTMGLMGGQYLATGNDAYLLVAIVVIFLIMFRYLNELEMFKVRSQLRAALSDAARRSGNADTDGVGDPVGNAAFLDEIQVVPAAESPTPVAEAADGQQVFDIQREFRSRFRRFMSFRNVLARHRIRPHLVSGIEFQMAVFVLAPLTGTIIPLTLAAGVLLLAFEFALIYKFWLSTQDATHTLTTLSAGPAATPGPPPAPPHSAARAASSESGGVK